MIVASASFAGMGMFGDHLIAIVLGLFFVDLGVQGVQILNQSTIYTLRPDTRSRITTAYMGCFFVAGAVGSILAGFSDQLAGRRARWPAFWKRSRWATER